MCFIGASCFGAKTIDAPWVTPDKAVLTRSNISPTLRESRSVDWSIIVRSVSVSSPTSNSPSTNIRKPSCVGMRPALMCGDPSNPICSKSCMTFLMVAALIFSLKSRVSVRDPTGSPLFKYPSTTRRKTSSDLSFISVRMVFESVMVLSFVAHN